MGFFTKRNEVKEAIDAMFRMEPEWTTDNSMFSGYLFADQIVFSKPTEDGIANGSLHNDLGKNTSVARISFIIGGTVIFAEEYFKAVKDSDNVNYNLIVEAIHSVYRDKKIDNAVERSYKQQVQQQEKMKKDERLRDRYLRSG